MPHKPVEPLHRQAVRYAITLNLAVGIVAWFVGWLRHGYGFDGLATHINEWLLPMLVAAAFTGLVGLALALGNTLQSVGVRLLAVAIAVAAASYLWSNVYFLAAGTA